jgi:hypothetical protein
VHAPCIATPLLCVWPCKLQVNHDAFQRMLGEYRDAKTKQKEDELKIKQ